MSVVNVTAKIGDILAGCRDLSAEDRVAFARLLVRDDGFAVVPVEPTEAMLDAGEEDEQGWRRMPYPRVRLKLHWEAMIAAAKETGDEG